MLIGICGEKNSGKSSVLQIVKRKIPTIEEISFAEPLKRFVGEVYGYSSEVLTGSSEAREPARKALQTLGDWGRKLDPDTWVNLGLRKYDPAKGAVIADVRFINEMKAIKAAGGVLWFKRPKTWPEDLDSRHISEVEMYYHQAMALYDLHIPYFSALEDLSSWVEQVLTNSL